MHETSQTQLNTNCKTQISTLQNMELQVKD